MVVERLMIFEEGLNISIDLEVSLDMYICSLRSS